MPVTTYIYDGESPRQYPYPPIMRDLEPGDELDLDEAHVPRDGRFYLKGPGGERLPLPDLEATAQVAASSHDEIDPGAPAPDPSTATPAAAKAKPSKTKE